MLVAAAMVIAILSQTDAPTEGAGKAEGTPTVRRVETVSDESVVAGFLKHVAANEDYPQSAREFVAGQAAPADESPGEFIDSSLAVLSPAFKDGLDHFFEDRHEAAAAAFEKLASDSDPFLAVAAAGFATSALVELDRIDRCRQMLTVIFEAHEPIDRYTVTPEGLRFMVAYCQVHNLEYAKAFESLESFLESYPDAPERLRTSAIQMLTELARRAPGQLGDVFDLMRYAQRKITHGEVGEPVVKRQKEAIDLLDALIEEAEQQEQQGQGDGGGGGGSPGGNQSGGGAKRSALPGGQATEGELRRRRARPGEAWGKMPPKERERILQDLQKQFPSRYRDLLEQYFEQLAKDSDEP